MQRQTGSTLIELLAVITVMGIAMGAATVYLQPASAPTDTGAVLLEGFFRLARARAAATTSACRVSASAPGEIIAEQADSCSATTWTADDEMVLALPQGVTVSDTTWSICFSPRGTADAAVTVTVQHPQAAAEQVEVVLGGTARVVP
jgi:prepilin-type N-terminal cleavage/methylation domain-containing protein